MAGEQDTIFAMSSGQGRAGVAVIRISGSRARETLATLTGSLPKPRLATLKTLAEPASHVPLDQALVLWFPGPASFTGEDTAELHIHGGRAGIAAVLGALGRLPGLRMAGPGEFSCRAFLNGKLDLTQAEGLADLIDAETEAQRAQSLRQTGGALRAIYDGWREHLLDSLAHVEAALDFSDERDVPETVAQSAWSRAASLLDEIRRHLDDGRRGEILREGFRIVIAGPPNAGKSSLLNALAKRDAAIVSEEAGTTRDVIEVRLDLDGLPVIVSDTAGIRETTGAIEREGIRRTMATIDDADLVLWLTDATALDTTWPSLPASLAPVPGANPDPPFDKSPDQVCLVLNKIDLCPRQADALPARTFALSATTGAGLDALVDFLAGVVRTRIGEHETPVVSRARHRSQLQACARALERFLESNPADLELRAEDLRQAALALGRITGRVDVEDVLDRLFGSFCIGK